jgi:hypothetical protein
VAATALIIAITHLIIDITQVIQITLHLQEHLIRGAVTVIAQVILTLTVPHLIIEAVDRHL